MLNISLERENIIDDKTLLENTFSIYGLHEYLKKDNLSFKLLFIKNYECFLKKIKLRFQNISEHEILRFARIYLIPDNGIIRHDGKETWDGKAVVCVSRVSFAGIYLKTDKDTNYMWMNENSGLKLL